MAADLTGEDYKDVEHERYVGFPSGVYHVWTEIFPDSPPMCLAEYCYGSGCSGHWVHQMSWLFDQLRQEHDLCYDVNSVHWTRRDGTLVHGLVLGPFYNQGVEKGDRAMQYVKAVLQRHKKYRGKEFSVMMLG